MIEGEKVIFIKVHSVFDLAGTDKLSRKEAILLLDEMREKDG